MFSYKNKYIDLLKRSSEDLRQLGHVSLALSAAIDIIVPDSGCDSCPVDKSTIYTCHQKGEDRPPSVGCKKSMRHILLKNANGKIITEPDEP